MKAIATVFVCVAATTLTVAQKVDLDRYSFVVSYRDLPTKPLDASYRTFVVLPTASRGVRLSMSDEELAGGIGIDGWKRMDGNRAHVIIKPVFEDVIIEKSGLSERVEVQKDKDGKETGRKYFYKLSLEYSFAADAQVIDYKGTQLLRTNLVSRFTRKTFFSDEFSSSKAANDYLNNNREELKGRFVREQVGAAQAQLSYTLSSQYGFMVQRANDHFWVLDSKKHPEFAAYQEAHQTVKQALAGVSPDVALDETKEKLKPAIAYYESLPTKYVGDAKADAKLRYSAYYNLAKLYLYLDEPEQVAKYTEALLANKYDEADARSLNERATALKELFEKNRTHTRHFAIDLSAVEPPQS